jgi:hypothetical protein
MMTGTLLAHDLAKDFGVKNFSWAKVARAERRESLRTNSSWISERDGTSAGSIR